MLVAAGCRSAEPPVIRRCRDTSMTSSLGPNNILPQDWPNICPLCYPSGALRKAPALKPRIRSQPWIWIGTRPITGCRKGAFNPLMAAVLGAVIWSMKEL